jgi:hypothetical protein
MKAVQALHGDLAQVGHVIHLFRPGMPLDGFHGETPRRTPRQVWGDDLGHPSHVAEGRYRARQAAEESVGAMR